LKKVTLDEFEKNLRRSLIRFSAHLKAEAGTTVMTKTAGAVRRLARNAANIFRQLLEKQANAPREHKREQHIQDEEDEDDDDLLEDREEGEDAMNLETILSKSVAFRLLEED
jgi:hypothetical protein